MTALVYETTFLGRLTNLPLNNGIVGWSLTNCERYMIVHLPTKSFMPDRRTTRIQGFQNTQAGFEISPSRWTPRIFKSRLSAERTLNAYCAGPWRTKRTSSSSGMPLSIVPDHTRSRPKRDYAIIPIRLLWSIPTTP
jgi:hypothetical protein